MEFACASAGNTGGELLYVAERHPEFRIEDQVQASKAGRRYAHDGKGMSREQNGFAQNGGSDAKRRCQSRWLRTITGRRSSLDKKPRPRAHGNLRDIEEVGGCRLAPDALRLAMAADRRG